MTCLGSKPYFLECGTEVEPGEVKIVETFSCAATQDGYFEDMDEIAILTKEEVKALPFDANWIGTLSKNSSRHYVKSKAQAIAWVKKVKKGWPGKWAVYEVFHYETKESIGWGATAI